MRLCQTLPYNLVNEFWDLWNFPNCIDAIDGKHVKIQSPPNSGSKFFNYTVFLLALVYSRYKFTVVDIWCNQ